MTPTPTLLDLLDPLHILRTYLRIAAASAVLPVVAASAIAERGPYPIYLPGGARGWTDKPPRARQMSGWRDK
jgi:hypothetical protein